MNSSTMEFYAIFLPEKKTDCSIKSFYTDKLEALAVLKSYKEARLKAFHTSEEAIYFYLHGPTESLSMKPSTNSTAATAVDGTSNDGQASDIGTGSAGNGHPADGSGGNGAPYTRLKKAPFYGPKSQELVAFRKAIETNNMEFVRRKVEANPRYLVSSGDMPTVLKEGPRYNALHVAAIEGSTDMCRYILRTIEQPEFIELLHGQRTASTEEVSAILLDLYLNMPDKCRSETPLHFASKFGSLGVIEQLIAYPQCKSTPNSDGLLPQDIICARAQAKNDTPAIRKAIGELLGERYFVPVLRAEDNSVPAIVGDPFSPSMPPKLTTTTTTPDKLLPQLMVTAYAGPMNLEHAKQFHRRWKTPPRLIVSPIRVPSSASKIPVLSPDSSNCSTPVSRFRGRRTLFPNRSMEIDDPLLNRINNNETEGEMLKAVTNATDERHATPAAKDSNGNVKSEILGPVDLFHRRYREMADANNSTLDSSCNVSCGEDCANFSYTCDETNSIYEAEQLHNSSSFKERRLRRHDPEKGLEIIGRRLSTEHSVGWQEYWSFLNTFTNISTPDGLQLLETFLSRQQQPQQCNTIAEQAETATVALSTDRNASITGLCDAMNSLCLFDALTSTKSMATPIQSPIGNPYLCIYKSLQVFARRFRAQLDDRANGAVDFNSLFQTAVVDCVKKLNTMVDNYRKDKAFQEIDFSKVHSSYAHLIVVSIDQEPPNTAAPVMHRLKVLLDKSREMNAANKHPDIHDSLVCLQNFLDFYIFKKDSLNRIDPFEQTELSCRQLWQDNVLIHSCNCRIDAIYSKQGNQERLSKRREKRRIFTEKLRKLLESSSEDEDDETYYSCGDSESDDDDIESNSLYGTPPSSFLLQQLTLEHISDGDGRHETKTYSNYICGLQPGRDDLNVFNVLEEHDIDQTLYPYISCWKQAMIQRCAQDPERSFVANTPKKSAQLRFANLCSPNYKSPGLSASFQFDLPDQRSVRPSSSPSLPLLNLSGIS